MSGLHWIDYAIIGIIFLSIITGIFRGFVKELLSLSIWALAIWMSLTYSEWVSTQLKSYIHDDTVRVAVSYLCVLVITLIMGAIFNQFISYLLHRSGLGGIDRTLGAGFGLLRGVFLIALVMLIVKMTSLPYQEYRNQSRLYSVFDPVVSLLYEYTPEIIKQMKVFDKDSQQS